MASEFLTRNEEIVDGIYRLGALLRRSVRNTVYETEFGEDRLPAVIKIRENESASPENLLERPRSDGDIERLRSAGELAHPNLLKIYAAGSSVLNDVPIVYVVMERADESLENVLAERALTESETRAMLVPVLEALQYLHKKGYAHARLRASNVLAVEDQLKLSCDSAIGVGDGGSPAEDIRALGVLIVQALTQKTPNADERWEAELFEEVPQPFADIVRHCLDSNPDRRWTVEQVKARLKGPAVEPLPSTPSLPAQPRLPTENASRPEEEEAEEDPEAIPTKRGIPKWIFAGLAALVLIVVLTAVLRNRASAPDATVPAAAPAQNQRVEASAPTVVDSRKMDSGKPGPVAPPETRSASRGESPPVVVRAGGRKAEGWSVIVAAYGSREPAEKRVRAMTRKWPNFSIRMLEPQAEKTHYLVVLGQNLSEDQAEALRKRAVESGLPGDTYIKRLK